MKQKISITAITSISALGGARVEVWNNYKDQNHYFTQKLYNGNPTWIASLPEQPRAKVEQLKESDNKYKRLDNSVLYAIAVSRDAMRQAGWKASIILASI